MLPHQMYLVWFQVVILSSYFLLANGLSKEELQLALEEVDKDAREVPCCLDIQRPGRWTKMLKVSLDGY